MRTSAHELIEGGPRLSAGVLTADLLELGAQLDVLDAVGLSLVHVDVMDGVFCPKTTVGPPIVRALPDRFIKDVHLMVDEPLEKLQPYIDAGAGIITIHLESTRHPHRVLQRLAGTGVVRGVALNPGTPVGMVEPLLDELDLLLLLAVNPGWDGQTFIRSTARRLLEARTLIADCDVALAVDGGVTEDNVERVASLGVDVVVAGSAIYDGVAPIDNARAMVDLIRVAADRRAAAVSDPSAAT